LGELEGDVGVEVIFECFFGVFLGVLNVVVVGVVGVDGRVEGVLFALCLTACCCFFFSFAC
jgi:hypothetical protein